MFKKLFSVKALMNMIQIAFGVWVYFALVQPTIGAVLQPFVNQIVAPIQSALPGGSNG